MQAFIITNRDVLDILRMSTQPQVYQDLLRDMVAMMDCDMTEYMFSIMSNYMIHYIPVSDINTHFDRDNRVIERFEPAKEYLDSSDFEVKSVNHLESILNSGAVQEYGNFDVNMHTDLHQQITDYHMSIEGSRILGRLQDQIAEELDSVVEMITHTAKSIEARYLKMSDDERTSNVLFGTKNKNLVVFVE